MSKRRFHTGQKSATPLGRIVLDIDGVMANFHEEVIKRMGPPKEMKEYSLAKWYPGRNKEIREIVVDPSTYMNLRPIVGSQKVVRWMAEAGFHIHIVTARPNVPGMDDVTNKWLRRHFNKMYRTLALVDYRKKAEYIASFAPHLAIDDSPEHVKGMRKRGVNVILFAQIYNHEAGRKDKLPVAMGWEHVKARLEMMRMVAS